MAIRFDYLLKETGSNLRRNVTLTIGVVITVAVSLSMFSSALLVREGIDNSFTNIQRDVVVFVFMQSKASEDQFSDMKRVLDDLQNNQGQVDRYEFCDLDCTQNEFRRLFERTPELVTTIRAEELPQSYRVYPAGGDADSAATLKGALEDRPGVFRVTFPEETVRQLQTSLEVIRNMIIAAAVVLLVASVLLVFNSISSAVFARRREIEVMRLVGAGNWFIRLPFILEGVVLGLVGAAIAAGMTLGFQRVWKDNFVGPELLRLFSSIDWTTRDYVTSVLLAALVGVLTGAIGSAIAVARYLRT